MSGLTKQGVRRLDPLSRNGRRDSGKSTEKRQETCAHQWAATDYFEMARHGVYERCVICKVPR